MRRPVVLVTGGSRGIGAATARLAAARGYDVALTYRSEREAAHSVVAECRALGAKACAVAGDIAAEADIVRFFDEAARELGPIGHVVNNAGVTGRSSRLDAADAAVIRTCIDVWLQRHEVVWAAAGHPSAVFSTSFDELVRLTGATPVEVV